MANKQIGWELKSSFPRGRLNGQRMHEASGEDLQSLGPLEAGWRPWVLQVLWGAKKGSLSGS